jgi:hypothetical protein
MCSLLSVAVLTMRLGSVGALRHSFNTSALGAEESFLTQASTQAPFTAFCQWRQTGGCSPTGPREPSKDKPCTTVIPTGPSGFCDCNGNGKQDAGEEGYNCGSTARACLNVCQLPCKTQSNCELLPNAVCDGRSCKVKSPWTNFGGEWQHNGKLTIDQDWDKITFIPQSGPRTSLVVGGGTQGEYLRWIVPTWQGKKLQLEYRGNLFMLLKTVTWHLETPQKLIEIQRNTQKPYGPMKTVYTCVGGACINEAAESEAQDEDSEGAWEEEGEVGDEEEELTEEETAVAAWEYGRRRYR